MAKRGNFNDQMIIILLLVISLFLFVESLFLYRFVKDKMAVEYEIEFQSLSAGLRILIGDEGYRLVAGESLIIKVRRNERVVVRQETLGRYTIKSGEKMVSVTIPQVEVSVR